MADDMELQRGHSTDTSTDDKTLPVKVLQKRNDLDVESPSIQNGPVANVPYARGIFGKLLSLEAALDRKLGIETHAIERVRPEQKTPQRWYQQAAMFLLWWGGILNLSTLSSGMLGAQLGFDFSQSVAITVFGNLLGAAVSGWCATLGPGTGLRQISISRYSFGWYPSKIAAALNVITQVGFSALACITAGSALSAVSDGRVNKVLGIVIIAAGSTVLNFCGLKAVVVYEKYAWILFFILFLVMYGELGPKTDYTTKSQLTGADISGNALTLVAVMYGSTVSWCTLAADYYVQYPINTSKVKVFFLCTMGITISTIIGTILGCCIGSTMVADQDLTDVYNNEGIGFLIQKMLYPRGFAKFVLVLMSLAGIGENALNLYSCSLSIQQFARPFALIPRFLWSIALFGVVVGLAIGAANSLSTYLLDFLTLLGYWMTSFFVLLFIEHYVFRKGSLDNYDLDGWSDPKRLPLGIAGCTAFLIGVVGWVLGMTETWFIGPLGGLIGSDGGDVANELTLVFTLVSYVPLRYLELKYVGR